MKRFLLPLVALIVLSGCETPASFRASVPQQYQQAPAPTIPIVSEEETEHWMQCAAGGIKYAIQQGKIANQKVIAYPIINRTQDKNLQHALEAEMSHAIKQLGLRPYPFSSQPNYEDLVDIAPGIILQTEISVFDRTIRAAEAEKEFGVNFGKGYGTGAISSPSSDRVNHGAIRATTTVEKFILQSKNSKRLSREVVETHASRANVFSRTTAHGVDFFLLVQYGNNLVLKEITGAQRALLTAARASIAGALLRNSGYDPAICKL